MGEGSLPLPPGTPGLPIIGETLAALRDPFGFVESRVRRHGAIFRTRILGRETVVITGPDAAAKFADEADVMRAGAMPGNIETLFGVRTLPVLDGDEHHARKAVLMAGFSHDAVAADLALCRRMVRAALGRWAAAGEVRAVDETRKLAIETICAAVMGLEAGPALDAILADYGRVLRAFSALPIALPGTAYSRGKRAMRRILARWRAEIARHEAASPPRVDGARLAERSPSREGSGTLSGFPSRDDGLARMLAAGGAGAAAALDADALAREIHHVVLAGLIVWAWCTRALLELDRAPALRARLVAEVAALPAEPSLEAMEAAPVLSSVVREVRRISSVVPLSFGKARRAFELGGRRVPAGWMVLWAPTASHARAEIYADPQRFDPDRFAAPRAEHTRHPHAFVPNGTGEVVRGHKCVGYLFAPALLQVFLVELARGYDWSIPADQDFGYVWAETPPPHKDGLRVRFTARPAG
jgi:cytochrome P450